MDCIICNTVLSGRKTKFCSKQCKSKFHNFHFDGQGHQIYMHQKKRGTERKLEFIELKGGKCQSCGYNKCIRALTFHHRDPSTKLFGVDIRTLGNMNYQKCFEEQEKCDLLCFNCHMELHDNELVGRP